MSFYNMMFGMNRNADILLALLGLKQTDIERFRDVSIDYDKSIIEIYTRTGGGNREDYPNTVLTSHPCYLYDHDDSYDSTYANYIFRFPEDISRDIGFLACPEEHGIPASVIKKVASVFNREPTEADKYKRIADEQHVLVKRLMENCEATVWNGHTVVPLSDNGMSSILASMEKHDGQFNAYWYVRPFKPEIRLNDCTWNMDRSKPDLQQDKKMVVIGNPVKGWAIDREWWSRWKTKFSEKYPVAMTKLIAQVDGETECPS